MSRELSSVAVLSYALRDRVSVTSTELMEKRAKIISDFGDVLADVSFASIRETVNLFEDLLEIRVSQGDYTIGKKSMSCCRKHRVGLFNDNYIEECLSPFFSKQECRRIKMILEVG